MGRDIKFRAWDEEDKSMHFGGFSVHATGNIGALPGIGPYNPIVMQYTGLDDKNGRGIYEGDIYHQGHPNIKYVVIFNDCQFVGSQIGNKSLAGLTYFMDKVEVIGNIYENQDLLNK